MNYNRHYSACRPLAYQAHIAVRRAVLAGDIPAPSTISCVDCGKDAQVYDHRDYTQPLAVDAVCRSCNRLRGPGHPYIDKPLEPDRRVKFRDMLKKHPRGTMAKVAAACGVSWAAVWQWGTVPAEKALAVERVTGIPRHVLRPDLFPIAREALATTEAA